MKAANSAQLARIRQIGGYRWLASSRTEPHLSRPKKRPLSPEEKLAFDRLVDLIEFAYRGTPAPRAWFCANFGMHYSRVSPGKFEFGISNSGNYCYHGPNSSGLSRIKNTRNTKYFTIENCCEVLSSKIFDYSVDPYTRENGARIPIRSIEKKNIISVCKEELFLEARLYENLFPNSGIRCPSRMPQYNDVQKSPLPESRIESREHTYRPRDKLLLQSEGKFNHDVYKDTQENRLLRVNYVRIMTFKNENLSLSARILPFFLGYGQNFANNGYPTIEYSLHLNNASERPEEVDAVFGNRYLNFIQFVEQSSIFPTVNYFSVLNQIFINFRIAQKLLVPAYIGIMTGISQAQVPFSNVAVFLPIPDIEVTDKIGENTRIILLDESKPACKEIFEILTKYFCTTVSRRIWMESSGHEIIRPLTKLTELLNKNIEWINIED
jgi:hypothetical protein